MNRTPEQDSAVQEYILAKERYDAAERVRGAAMDMLEALKYVAERIRNSDEWWMDCPDKGGFDLDLIESAIAKAEGK